MKQKIITLLLVIGITALLSVVVVVSNNKDKQAAIQKVEELKTSEPIFYYGDTCPHCHAVSNWFSQNKVEEKMTIIKKEVYNDTQNANELSKVAASCGLDTSNIGVPFLYAEGQCLVGTTDIVNYVANKTGLDASTFSESSN